MIKNNIPPYVIWVKKFSKVRGKKFKITLSDGKTNINGTYIVSSIKGVKSPRLTYGEDEFYLFHHKKLGYFMLEKEVIYDKDIDCSQWEGLIDV